MTFLMAHMDDSTINTTLDYIKATARNATLFLVPSPKDLLYFLPRMATRAGTFVIEEIPGAFHNVFDGALNGHAIADATADAHREVVMAASTTAAGVGAAAMDADAMNSDTATAIWRFVQAFNIHHLGSLGGIFAYMTSKWFISCFAVAMILNRTTIYASARRNLHLSWQGRALLRIVPIILLLGLSQNLLQTMHCQTSPEYSALRYGDMAKKSRLDFSGEGGLLHGISSTALFWESDEDSCLAADMIPNLEAPVPIPRGSLGTLWPSFGVFCVAQFVETLSCALHGTTPATEIGMSLFEHSLAFAEAEAMVSNHILARLRGDKDTKPKSSKSKPEPTISLKSSYVLSRFNVPPEVLLVALLSCLNHLSSHVLGVFGLQAKYRLLNTGIWGVAFISAFFWATFTTTRDHGVNAGILRFPTVCVVGFIPHVLILIGLSICGSIYALALGMSVLFPPEHIPRNVSWRERLRLAHSNMQANIPLAGLSVNMREDFYTSLLRTGFTALTAASEAVFLNEGRRINVGYWTWLEEERMQEVSNTSRAYSHSQMRIGLDFDSVASGVALSGIETKADDTPEQKGMSGGYAREKGTKALQDKSTRSIRKNDGVGAHQRGTRFVFAFGFLSGIFWLLTGWLASIYLKTLDRIGLQRRPAWIMSLFESAMDRQSETKTKFEPKPELEFWLLSESGSLALPKDGNVDVAIETKKRMQMVEENWGDEQEANLESTLYSWFTSGGWWGERDESGDYQQSQADDDAQSVISTSTAASENDWETEASGQVTPTQSDYGGGERKPIPSASDLALNPTELARLLNPQDSEARDEARMLAAHLSSDQILTRRRYQGSSDPIKSQVLVSSRYRPPGFKPAAPSGKLTPDEEAEVLEYLIIKYRDMKRGGANGKSDSDWINGADGLGANGPQCVVCQSSPRTILAWPCRCLSLCEECRVSLAMNNFGSCVCCRQEVVAFSRLFVP